MGPGSRPGPFGPWARAFFFGPWAHLGPFWALGLRAPGPFLGIVGARGPLFSWFYTITRTYFT